MYLRALEIDPDYYKARNNYALCVIQQGTLTVGNAQEALRAFFQLQQQDPNDPRLPKLKEFIDKLDAEALAKFKKGEAELLEILRRHPDDNVTLMNLGNLYFGYLDRLDDAVDMVDKSIVQNDREPMAFAVSGEIYFSRGNERVDAGRSDEAMADYRKAIERYREYLARVGQSRDPDNYKHILERKTKCEQALKERKRAEPKREGFGTVNPFQNAPGQGSGRVTRWKPKASSQ
jgi:tetratricopeptide (TPR) repeat protein